VLRDLGAQLDLSAEEAALGVIRIANATMERALRRVSVEQGYDPRRFVLFPFGGAGPLHACDLADALGMQRILVPAIPGVLSAYGMLVADIANDAAQTVLSRADDLCHDLDPLLAVFSGLEGRVRSVLRAEGVPDPAIRAGLDMRYRGQSYELTVPFTLPITLAGLDQAIAAFHTAHAQRYGYAMPEESVEVVTLRVRGSSPGAQPRPEGSRPTLPWAGDDASPARLADKAVWFAASGPVPTACYDRALLRPGNRFAGPAIVFQFDATVIAGPGWRASVDAWGNIWLERD
jgi:N-methylhydantoinase A